MQNILQDRVVDLNTYQSQKSETASKVSKPQSLSPALNARYMSEPVKNLKLSEIKIIKKDGTLEDYNIEKVVAAIQKSAARSLVTFSDNDINNICNLVD
ncbi:hypothetical protein IJF81_06760, partial [bacterium]|nr:hypothetical protein [bacterium]